MAKKCNCHVNINLAIKGGMSFHEANHKYGISGYHEHCCECKCGCKVDTCGYKYCAYCAFNCER